MGVERQREDLAKLAEGLGLRVVSWFEDNDISASTRSRKCREDFEEMLRAAARGEFSTVLAYTSSRLTRRPRENEDLIGLAERYGVRFRYVSSPSFDLNTADGRNVARILASNDAAESERVAERVSRAAAQRAAAGMTHGGRPAFGYRTVVNDAGQVTAWEIDPERAGWVREAVRRVLAGESAYGIALEWNRQGRRTATGKIWTPRAVRRILTTPSITGLREHEGHFVSARWGGILEREVWDRVQALLIVPSRRSGPRSVPDGRGKYMLSGLLYCGACRNIKLTVSRRIKRDGTRCAITVCSPASGGCARGSIDLPLLEEWVFAAFAAALETMQVPAPPQDDTSQAAEVSRAIEADTRMLSRVQDDYYDGTITEEERQRQVRRLRTRIEDNQTTLAGLVTATHRAYIPAPQEIVRQWPDKDPKWRHAMLSALIEKIYIGPHPAGVPHHLARRKTETDQEYRDRNTAHSARMLAERVDIRWKI